MSTKNSAIQKAVIVSPSIHLSVFNSPAIRAARETQKQKSQTFVTKQIQIDLLVTKVWLSETF